MEEIDTKTKNIHLRTLMFLMFVSMSGYIAIVPFLPELFSNIKSEYYILPSYIDPHYGLLLQGLLLGTYALFTFFSAPVLGELSDYYGRKRILKICLLGSALGYFIFGYAILTHNIWLLFFSRFLDGITGGSISIIQASAVDISKKEEISKNINRVLAMISIAVIAGPLFATIFGSKEVFYLFNYGTPFIIIGILNILSIYILGKYLIEAKHKDSNANYDEQYHKDNRFSLNKIHPFYSLNIIKDTLKMKSIRDYILIHFIFCISIFMFSNFAPNLLHIRLDFGVKELGIYYGVIGTIIAMYQFFIIPKINKKFDNKKTLNIFYPILGIIFPLYSILIYNIPVLLIFVLLIPLFWSTIASNITLLITKHTDTNNRGKIYGIISSSQSLGQTLSPIIGGISATIFFYYTPFYVAGILLFIGTIILWKLK